MGIIWLFWFNIKVLINIIVLPVLGFGAIVHSVKSFSNISQRGSLVHLIQKLGSNPSSIVIIVQVVVHEIELLVHMVVMSFEDCLLFLEVLGAVLKPILEHIIEETLLCVVIANCTELDVVIDLRLTFISNQIVVTVVI